MLLKGRPKRENGFLGPVGDLFDGKLPGPLIALISRVDVEDGPVTGICVGGCAIIRAHLEWLESAALENNPSKTFGGRNGHPIKLVSCHAKLIIRGIKCLR